MSKKSAGLFDRKALDLAVDRIKSSVEVNVEYDIPFVAGYSKNGKTIYIDHNLPATLKFKGGRCNLHDYLILHEATEKALIDTYGMTYLEAHAIACFVDRTSSVVHCVPIESYLGALNDAWKGGDLARIQKVPRDLDLTPYKEVGSVALLEKMKRAMTEVHTVTKQKSVKKSGKSDAELFDAGMRRAQRQILRDRIGVGE